MRKTNHSALSNLEKQSDEANYKTEQKLDSAVDGVLQKERTVLKLKKKNHRNWASNVVESISGNPQIEWSSQAISLK